jgi:hypothetical protein
MFRIINHYHHRIITAFLISVLALLGACGGSSTSYGNAPVTISSLALSPQTTQFTKDSSKQFTAIAKFSDNSTKDVSQLASWESINSTVATVNSAGLASGASQGNTTITASYEGIKASTVINGVTISGAMMTDLQISPQDATVAKGLSKQYNAIAIYSDGSNQNVTASAQWASGSPDVAQISTSGLASTKLAGTSIITATVGGLSDSAELTVGDATLQEITLSPSSATIKRNLSKQFTATGAYSDGNNVDISPDVTWFSGDTARLTINNTGLATATATATSGTVSISASFDNITGSVSVNVSDVELSGISINPATATVPVGRSQQFIATGSYSDGATENISSTATWASADPSAVAIDSIGNASAIKVSNNIAITASSGEFSASAQMTVSNAALETMEVTPPNATIPNGGNQQYTATGIYTDNSRVDLTSTATWQSTDRSIANISNVADNQGSALGRAAGSVDISATLDSISGKAVLTVTDAVLRNIQVTPSGEDLANGFQREFTATGFYSDGSSKVISESLNWDSSDGAVATASNVAGEKGVVTADATNTGAVSIRAASNNISGFASLNITNAILDSINLGSDKSIPLDPDTRLPFVAEGTFNDATTLDISKQVTWASADEDIASISNQDGKQGQTTPVGIGSTDITATRTLAITGTVQLTITAATLEQISVTPQTTSVAAGRTQQYTATGSYSDNTTGTITDDVIWSTDDQRVTISNANLTKGEATTTAAAADKKFNISAVHSNGVTSNKATLSVTSAVLNSIEISTNPVGKGTTPAGTNVQYIATGSFSDGSKSDLTGAVSWSVLNETPNDPAKPNVGDISNSAGSKGLVSTSNPGDIDVRASSGGKDSNDLELKVNNAIITGLSVTPQTATIPLNGRQQFIATATFSDGTTSTVTENSDGTAWRSSDLDVIGTVNNGLAISKGQAGNTDIIAVFDGETAFGTLTVSPATLVSISIADLADIPAGQSRQLIATGTYSDATTQNITTTVTWASFNGNAVISNADGSRGLLSSVQVGLETVSANLNGVTEQGDIIVTSAVLSSIVVTPADNNAPSNSSLQFTATGIYSDNSEVDFTTKVTWTSTNEDAAEISNAAGSQGLAQTKSPLPLGPQDTQIEAYDPESTLRGTTTLTVSDI